MTSASDAAPATPPTVDSPAREAGRTSKSWEKLDIDAVRAADEGGVSGRLTGKRIVPLAGALAGIACLGALAGAAWGRIARRDR